MSINRIFVAKKPEGNSCNYFLRSIKKKYGVKKAGFSGTLDPFASGCLIIAFGQYTKLFRFLKKAPKRYLACLHLGAKSKSLDTENIESISEVGEVELTLIEEIAKKLTTSLVYTPPKFSAKRVDGKRAYELARKDMEVNLKEISTQVYSLNITDYSHPFITFDISVSEGGYIRSIGEMIANELGVCGSLKSLCRVSEGEFIYEDEKPLNPLEFLNLEQNFYEGDQEDILLGRKVDIKNFRLKEDGEYYLVCDNFLSIIKIENGEVGYELNRIAL